eukprot:g7855.t1
MACRLSKDDYRIWQRALISSELSTAVEPLFKRHAKRALPLARKEDQKAFLKATQQEGPEDEDEDRSDPLSDLLMLLPYSLSGTVGEYKFGRDTLVKSFWPLQCLSARAQKWKSRETIWYETKS